AGEGRGAGAGLMQGAVVEVRVSGDGDAAGEGRAGGVVDAEGVVTIGQRDGAGDGDRGRPGDADAAAAEEDGVCAGPEGRLIADREDVAATDGDIAGKIIGRGEDDGAAA